MLKIEIMFTEDNKIGIGKFRFGLFTRFFATIATAQLLGILFFGGNLKITML